MSSTTSIDPARLRAALDRASAALLAERTPQGHWVGELSSSALSTATAVTALAIVQRELRTATHDARIASGLHWLAQHQNADGGWGDTVLSLSNLSTTTLCWAAFGAVPGAEEKFFAMVRRAEKWIADKVTKQDRPHLTPAENESSFTRGSAHGPPSGSGEGEPLASIDTDKLARAVIARYGKDRTFSVPILTMCALAGRLGSGRAAWKHVIPLPFELAACPHSWFAALRLPVVSYALPALIAIGQARHHHRPSPNPVARVLRNLTREKTLRVLTGIQPASGGFLEATPLTSFVTMSLAGSGQVHHPVTKRGVEFLVASQRPDGSWPIDTNLATWVTTLAINALGDNSSLLTSHSSHLRSWLLAQQYRAVHPYTHAAPGGWAWTDLPGGVPDADDTAGALLALSKLGPIDDPTREAAFAGIRWLLNVQNRDGGIPTFCRGWGALPFDQSSADLTAHAVRAWSVWFDDLPKSLRRRVERSGAAAMEFLSDHQHEDGSWSPLWFGNQHVSGESNLTYGASRVVRALADVAACEASAGQSAQVFGCDWDSLRKGTTWLIQAQNPDGSWGGNKNCPGSIEETALALEALAGAQATELSDLAVGESALPQSVERGTQWLLARVESGEWTQPSPIGFYFAKLWYYEKLYPMIFTVGALNRVAALMDPHSTVTR